MGIIDIFITIVCFIIVFLLFLQPTSQDKLAGFLSGSVDPVASYQNIKERGTTKILFYLTIFFTFLILVLLIVARLLL